MKDRYFPSHVSTPDPAAPVERVLIQYPLLQPVHCQLYRAGRNDHYRVHAGGETYHLKVYGVSQHWQTQRAYRERVRSEVDLMLHLCACGVPAPAPVQRRDGAHLSAFDAPEGLRYAYLLRTVPGQPLGDAVTLEHVRAVARLAAHMHACMDALPESFTPVNWDLRWLVDVPLQQVAPALAHRPEDLAYLQETGASVKDRIRTLLPQHAPAYGIIHGDLHQDNIYLHSEGLALVDFESFGRGWRAWEIAYYLTGEFSDWLWDAQAEAERERRRAAFLEAYLAERPLSEAELVAFHVFPVARYLVAMGRIASLNARVDGQLAAEDREVTRWIAYLRRWIEQYRPL